MGRAELQSLQLRFENALVQALIGQGLVGRDMIEEALSFQVVVGGHLSTNLWDLGLSDGSAVRKLSAGLLHLPVVDPDKAVTILPAVLNLVSRATAASTRIVPLRVDGKTLHVATCEPWNVEATEQIAFETGHKIACCYASEIDVTRLLERHYRIPSLARLRLGPHRRPVVEGNDEQVVEPKLTADLISEESFDAMYYGGADSKEATEREEDLPEIELLPEDEIVDEVALEPISEISEATRLLDEAPSRDAVGDIMARFALSRGKRVALLVLHGGVWTGWAGAGIDPRSLRALMVPAEPGTLFGLVSQTGAHFLGPPAPHRIHDHFLRVIGDARPKSVGLFPVHYRGRLAFGIYLDAGDGAYASTDIAELLILAQRVPLALERLVQQRLGA